MENFSARARGKHENMDTIESFDVDLTLQATLLVLPRMFVSCLISWGISERQVVA